VSAAANKSDSRKPRNGMRDEFARLHYTIDVAVRDLKIWTAGLAIILVVALAFLKYFA
jgi:hypothetical protein